MRSATRLAEATVGLAVAVAVGILAFVVRVLARVLISPRDAWGSFLALLVITVITIQLARACGAS